MANYLREHCNLKLPDGRTVIGVASYGRHDTAADWGLSAADFAKLQRAFQFTDCDTLTMECAECILETPELRKNFIGKARPKMATATLSAEEKRYVADVHQRAKKVLTPAVFESDVARIGARKRSTFEAESHVAKPLPRGQSFLATYYRRKPAAPAATPRLTEDARRHRISQQLERASEKLERIAGCRPDLEERINQLAWAEALGKCPDAAEVFALSRKIDDSVFNLTGRN